jgi:phosphoglycolate phosphatase-like HAD superfamily hydrolase
VGNALAMAARESSGAVLFDVDGTLVDSNYLHVVAWMAAFQDAGHPVDACAIHRAIGMGATQLLEALLGENLARTAGESVKRGHRERYGKNLESLRRFEGSRRLLRAVSQRARVVLATSAGSDEFDALRAALGADDAVSAVTTDADVEEAKPAPDLIGVALEKVGVGPDRAVLVGDRVWDVKASARAGVPCVAVLSGGIGAAELRDAGAVKIYRNVLDLLENLDDSPLAAVFGPGTSAARQRGSK